MLGRREPEIYGSETLQDIEAKCNQHAGSKEINIDFFQSNYEGVIIERLQTALDQYDGIIANMAAYTHSSIAIHDALKMYSCPIIEVHLSDPKTREDFRHISYIEPLAACVIAGQGSDGYLQAIDKIEEIINK